MRNFLSRIMTGRYGPDHLGVALVVASLIIGIAGRLIGIELFFFLSYAPIVLALVRMFSRDFSSRRRENDIFLRYYAPLRMKVKRRFTALKEFKTHKYFKCPACKNMLRVPRGRGKLWVTCPKCGERFMRNSGKPWS